jgi:flagellar hook-associated protein 1 FlgK
MSLFGSIQVASNALNAMQIGLHVVGQNIANANTPGYIRERTIFTTAPVQELGDLSLGLGVQVSGIVQNVDKFVETRLRDAGSDRASAEVQEKIYRDLQAILGELTDNDLSSTLANYCRSAARRGRRPASRVDGQHVGPARAERVQRLQHAR